MEANFQYIVGRNGLDQSQLALCFYFILLFVGEGQSATHSSTNTRTPIGRLMTPRSQAGNALESIGDSDEEGTEYANEDDDIFNYGNADALDNSITVRVPLILAYFFPCFALMLIGK